MPFSQPLRLHSSLLSFTPSPQRGTSLHSSEGNLTSLPHLRGEPHTSSLLLSFTPLLLSFTPLLLSFTPRSRTSPPHSSEGNLTSLLGREPHFTPRKGTSHFALRSSSPLLTSLLGREPHFTPRKGTSLHSSEGNLTLPHLRGEPHTSSLHFLTSEGNLTLRSRITIVMVIRQTLSHLLRF